MGHGLVITYVIVLLLECLNGESGYKLYRIRCYQLGFQPVWSRTLTSGHASRPCSLSGAAACTIVVVTLLPLQPCGRPQAAGESARRTLALLMSQCFTRNGLLSFSSPIVVSGPWPGITSVLSGKERTRSCRERMI